MNLRADAYASAYNAYRRAVALNTASPTALRGLIDAAAGLRRQDEARAWLERIAAAEPANANVRIELSRVVTATGDLERGATLAAEAMRLAPDDFRAADQLAAVFADAGDGRRLGPFADALASRFPALDKPRFYRARAFLLNGDAQRAVEEAKRLVVRQPGDVRAQNLLGAACATAGDRGCAASAFAAAMRASPRDPETYVNAGVLQLRGGDPESAARNFAIAAAIDRSSSAARQGLAEARAALNAPR
jgi:Flp pilus assembly protein TadD